MDLKTKLESRYPDFKKVPENGVKNKVFPRCHSCERYERGLGLPKCGEKRMTSYKVLFTDRDGVSRVVVLTERTAIRLRCLGCRGWDPGAVARCPIRKCALWPHRLCRGPQAGGLRRQAILAYCYWCMDFRLHEKEKCPVRHCPLFIFRSPVVDLSVAIEVDRSWIRQKKLR